MTPSHQRLSSILIRWLPIMRCFSIQLLLLSVFALACEARPRSNFTPKNIAVKPVHEKDVVQARGKTVPFTSKDVMTSLNGGGTKSTMKAAIFNLVKGIVGAGVLSLPAGVAAFGDEQSAVIPAVALVTIAGALSGYNFSLIGRLCALTGATSYAGAWEKSVGDATAWIPAGAVCVRATILSFFVLFFHDLAHVPISHDRFYFNI